MSGSQLPAFASTRYGLAALAHESDRLIHGMEPGPRHTLVYRSAFRMGQLVAAGELDEFRAKALLVRVAESLGLPTSDALRQVERGLRKGQGQPRGPRAINGEMIRTRNEACLLAVTLWDEAVASHEWTGRTGATRLRLLAAFCLLSMSVGKVRLSLSTRQWAEMAGVSHTSVTRLAITLTPWLVRSKRGNRFAGNAAVWQLGTTKKRGNSSKPEASTTGTARMEQNPRMPAAGSILSPSLDVFHRRPVAWMIYNLLAADGCGESEWTVKAIAEQYKLHPSTVRTNLHYLLGFAMAERIDRFTWRGLACPTEDLATAVPAYGEQRKARHAAERKAYKRRFVDLETGEILRRPPKDRVVEVIRG